MISYLLNLSINIAITLAGIGVVLALLSTRFKSWQPLSRLYLKLLKTSVTATAKLLWKPEMKREGIGHIAAAPPDGEET